MYCCYANILTAESVMLKNSTQYNNIICIQTLKNVFLCSEIHANKYLSFQIFDNDVSGILIEY